MVQWVDSEVVPPLTNEMVKWWWPMALRSMVAKAWNSTDDEVSRIERGSGCTTQKQWKVASTVLNVVGLSPSDAVAAVYSSSVTIESVTSPCGKKATEPDGVLRFAMSGPRLRVHDAAADDGPMSGSSGSAMVVGGAIKVSESLQTGPSYTGGLGPSRCRSCCGIGCGRPEAELTVCNGGKGGANIANGGTAARVVALLVDPLTIQSG
jgi:hypothetical protein